MRVNTTANYGTNSTNPMKVFDPELKRIQEVMGCPRCGAAIQERIGFQQACEKPGYEPAGPTLRCKKSQII